VFHGRPARHIQTHLAEDDQGRGLVNAFDLRQIHAADPVQGLPHGKRWVIAAPLARAGGRGQGLAIAPVREGLEVRLDVLITFGDFLVIHLIEGDRLGQSKQMFVAPIALQGAGDGGLIVLAAIVTQLGQRRRITLAGQDGADNRQAGHAGKVADHMLQLDVHLGQRFLHMLDMLRGMGEQHRALAEITAQHADLVSRTEGTREQTEGVQALNPLAVMPIALGSAFDLLHLLRIDQEDCEAAGFEEFKERDPIDAGGLEGDGGDPTGGEPVRQRFQVGSAGPEAAYWLGVVTGGDGNPVGFGTDVDARGMQVDGCQLGWERGRGPGCFPLALRHGCLHNATK
jgi:hypothetical protein